MTRCRTMRGSLSWIPWYERLKPVTARRLIRFFAPTKTVFGRFVDV